MDTLATFDAELTVSHKHLPMQAICVPADALIELASSDVVKVMDVDAPHA